MPGQTALRNEVIEVHRSGATSYHIEGTVIGIAGQEYIIGPTTEGFHGTDGGTDRADGGINPENYTFHVLRRANGQRVIDPETSIVYIYRSGPGIDPHAPYENNGEFFTLCGVDEVATDDPAPVESTNPDGLADWERELLAASAFFDPTPTPIYGGTAQYPGTCSICGFALGESESERTTHVQCEAHGEARICDWCEVPLRPEDLSMHPECEGQLLAQADWDDDE